MKRITIILALIATATLITSFTVDKLKSNKEAALKASEKTQKFPNVKDAELASWD